MEKKKFTLPPNIVLTQEKTEQLTGRTTAYTEFPIARVPKNDRDTISKSAEFVSSQLNNGNSNASGHERFYLRGKQINIIVTTRENIPTLSS